MLSFKSLILVAVLSLGCTSPNYHIYLICTYSKGINNDTKVSEYSKEVKMQDIQRLSNDSVLLQLKVKSSFKIPVDSKFELVNSDFLGTKSVKIHFSEEQEYIAHNDTIICWKSKHNGINEFFEDSDNDSLRIRAIEESIDLFLDN